MDEETQDVVPAEEELALDPAEQKFEDQKRRAEKAEAEAKELKEKLSVLDKLQTAFNNEEVVPEEPKGPDPNSRVDELEETLILKDKGYTTEEVLAMRNYAKGAGKKTIEVENDPFIQGAIATMRQGKEVEQTTPPPSAPQPQAVGTSDVKFDDQGKVVKSAPTSFADWQAKQAQKGKAE